MQPVMQVYRLGEVNSQMIELGHYYIGIFSTGMLDSVEIKILKMMFLAQGSKSIECHWVIVAVMKYVEGMLLYRLEKHFERLGIELPRAILSNWIIKGGQMLEPLYNRMYKDLLGLSVLHADETHLQILREDGRPAKSKSHM